ncbi:hypothetical protein BD779DRAFT_1462375 [Infundibulicybe gibba]|nr:hypothetical protein BD779DRAFT_1462375 [Infundibulicybe gibba]
MPGQELQDLVKWLSPLDFGEKHNAILEKRTRDTGEWFLQHPKFLAWRRGDPEYKTLWCPGNPGVGKSVMVSLVINELGKVIPESTALAFIYLEYKTKYMVTQLAEVILKQLVQRRIMQSSLESLRKHKAGIHPTSAELFDMLKIEVGTYSEHVLIVIDFSPQVLELASSFYKYLRTLPNIGILATSWDVSEIGLGLQPHQCLDIVADEGDMRKYIEGRLASSVKFKQLLEGRPSIHEEIITKTTMKADGMFLLTQLHINSLETKLRVTDLCQALDKLPNTLDATYDEAMSRINEDHKALAYRIISWLIHAAHPMTIYDLQYALAVGDRMTALDTDDLYNEAFLTSVCGGLVVVQEDTANTSSKFVGLVRKLFIRSWILLMAIYIQITRHSNIF